MTRNRMGLPLAWITVLSCLPAVAGDSPLFRGPAGNGIYSEKGVPTEWDRETNVKWKVALPQPGNSSPIVSAGRVFLTCAQDNQGKQRSLYCFDRKDGKQLWVKTIDFGRKMPTHKTNPYCASTPAADGERVVVFHGSAGVYCYDFEGKELWRRDLGEFRHDWGYASSPVIYKDRVILNCGPGKNTFMAALNLSDGVVLWKTPEELDGNGEKRAKGGYIGTWATPLIAKVKGKDQIICTMPTRLAGYDPADGKLLWWCDGIRGSRGDLAYSSPMVSGDLAVAIGGYRGPGLGVTLGSGGDLTESRLWRIEQNPQSIGTGVFHEGHLFRANAGPGTIECIDPKTGKAVWTQRAQGTFWGSIVMAEGNMFVTTQNGRTYVFKPNPQKFELVATNDLRESSNSTPAFSDGNVFLRTFNNLYCIGK